MLHAVAVAQNQTSRFLVSVNFSYVLTLNMKMMTLVIMMFMDCIADFSAFGKHNFYDS